MFVFDQSIETGNPIIDGEHKQLIAAINDMLSACVRGRAGEAAEKAIQFMQDYIVKHFDHEEVLQKRSGYPDYERHHQLHEGYKQVVDQLAKEYRQTGPTAAMLNKLNNNVGGWLINHIKREDAKLAAYLREKQ